ncbi:hypothetical protein JMA_02610 [Jeotgalibacillus malaysiensis]|uniref:Uncharacterized protein n=1 Tax=Jeotgalibacillus malaysiensis TaxID=1508404 RepID=A0A0B5AM04_9BACL|nr:hypothetical protein JMA_02610 [Jeotgalibacillus malaysiensis]
MLYAGFQIISGHILTALYTPDPVITSQSTGETPVFYFSPDIQLIGVLVIATLAYLFSQKLVKNA